MPCGLCHVSYMSAMSHHNVRWTATSEKVQTDAKWMQHRDFPGGHPSQYYSGPKALNFRVLMGSGVVALV